jgi:hypothetical protein
VTSKVFGLVVAAAAVVFQGCASDEPRELGRDDDVGTLEGDQTGPVDQQQRQGGAWNTAGAQQLDGKVFQIQLEGEDDKVIPSQLSFRDGKMESSACKEHGFQAVPYTVTPGEDGTLKFSATATAGAATNRWNGVIRGNTIEGTASMQQPGKDACECEFKGTAVQNAGYDASQGKVEGQGASQDIEGQDLEGEEGQNPATKDPSGRHPNAGPM